MAGTQDFEVDPRNANLLVFVNGALVPRDEARVSIFDAGFSMGDGVWEGLRLHQGALLFLDAHLDRLMAGAAAIGIADKLDRGALEEALWRTIEANGMQGGGGVHLRLMVTRGLKSTASQDPRNIIGPPSVVITAEHKRPKPASGGLRLVTVSVRCAAPEMFDMRLNSHSRLPLILALNEAIAAGADEALMLDPHGFVSTCNATNFFFVAEDEVRTSAGRYCFNGITRSVVIALCQENRIPSRLGDFPPSALAQASEAFVTGTMGGLAPVAAIDGRALAAAPGPVTERLRALYAERIDAEAALARRR
ncbi:MAG TPA: aminotransferase class IV [Caulobacteraceae bacterium]|nr:aminotransferase class IV [Caulobacteraceae bacterium]